MRTDNPGVQLLSLLSSGRERILLIAPFIKTDALRRALDAVPKAVKNIDCITRWRPEDIVDGVCDIDIFDVLTDSGRAQLWLKADLHAKYFRVDERCLIGSANLTGRALGWHVPGNLELMIEVPCSFSGLEDWERDLMAECTLVTKKIRDQIAMDAQALAAQRPKQYSIDVEQGDSLDPKWVPLCPLPEILFDMHNGSIDNSQMSESNHGLAQHDLRALSPPPGLSDTLFRAHVVTVIQTLEVFQIIFQDSPSGITDKQGEILLEKYLDPSFEIAPCDAWESVKKWMIHFFPDDYLIEVGQHVLVKGSKLKNR